MRYRQGGPGDPAGVQEFTPDRVAASRATCERILTHIVSASFFGVRTTCLLLHDVRAVVAGVANENVRGATAAEVELLAMC
jgi:hypothetical protein